MKVPSAHAYAIESTLSDAALAALPCAYSAAENMIERAGVAAGERVLVTGASGGVGSAAVQLARRRGAHVLPVTSAGKAAEALARAERLIASFEDETLSAEFEQRRARLPGYRR